MSTGQGTISETPGACLGTSVSTTVCIWGAPWGVRHISDPGRLTTYTRPVNAPVNAQRLFSSTRNRDHPLLAAIVTRARPGRFDPSSYPRNERATDPNGLFGGAPSATRQDGGRVRVVKESYPAAALLQPSHISGNTREFRIPSHIRAVGEPEQGRSMSTPILVYWYYPGRQSVWKFKHALKPTLSNRETRDASLQPPIKVNIPPPRTVDDFPQETCGDRKLSEIEKLMENLWDTDRSPRNPCYESTDRQIAVDAGADRRRLEIPSTPTVLPLHQGECDARVSPKCERITLLKGHPLEGRIYATAEKQLVQRVNAGPVQQPQSHDQSRQRDYVGLPEFHFEELEDVQSTQFCVKFPNINPILVWPERKFRPSELCCQRQSSPIWAMSTSNCLQWLGCGGIVGSSFAYKQSTARKCVLWQSLETYFQYSPSLYRGAFSEKWAGEGTREQDACALIARFWPATDPVTFPFKKPMAMHLRSFKDIAVELSELLRISILPANFCHQKSVDTIVLVWVAAPTPPTPPSHTTPGGRRFAPQQDP
ncbi:hypothetical protein FA13DRAFT_1707058 [Coprinellus micaceus]|uniref:Uncharacterized protein n=1 Tax=Coprinellus micaceus TaxID=71717 RepID=A0A4Y7TKZ1_COPMI|nr:hypothetical protein FA13DRAFT_1707058 [Coprinellus micaceus]